MSDHRVRGYCFTLNNYTQEEYDRICALKTAYMIVGKEIAPTTGTPHLQGYLYFKDGKSLRTLQKASARAHWEPAKGDAEANYKYCSKGGDFLEVGKRPMTQKEKGDKGKEKIQERWALAKAGKFQELPPEQIKVYEYIYNKNFVPTDRDTLDNYWIYGKSGCGKSSLIRKTFETFFTKSMSKWWDGYNQEEVVVLDDFDPKHGEFLGYYLKIWADHYAFNAEIKGGMLKIRPKIVIITSQYPIDSCFQDKETIDAVTRRFQQINVIKGENNLKATEFTNHARQKVPKAIPRDPQTPTIQEAFDKCVEDHKEVRQEHDSSSD